MPLQLDSLEALQTYIESYPGIPLFYRVADGSLSREVVIMAGKAAWRGSLEPSNIELLEKWLIEHGGIRVKGYRELRELFG
jgi:hypothetical protein